MTKYNDHAYLKRTRALRAAVEAQGLPCHLCGQPIDLTLPHTHPLSFTADHITPLATGGHLHGTLAPAHRTCNSARGKRRLPSQVTKPRTTKHW